MEIALDPVWNKEVQSASVRCGGIENYDEVASFFRGLPAPPQSEAYIAEIIGLQYKKERPNWVVIDLQGHGHIIVKSNHVTES